MPRDSSSCTQLISGSSGCSCRVVGGGRSGGAGGEHVRKRQGQGPRRPLGPDRARRRWQHFGGSRPAAHVPGAAPLHASSTLQCTKSLIHDPTAARQVTFLLPRRTLRCQAGWRTTTALSDYGWASIARVSVFIADNYCDGLCVDLPVSVPRGDMCLPLTFPRPPQAEQRRLRDFWQHSAYNLNAKNAAGAHAPPHCCLRSHSTAATTALCVP